MSIFDKNLPTRTILNVFYRKKELSPFFKKENRILIFLLPLCLAFLTSNLVSAQTIKASTGLKMNRNTSNNTLPSVERTIALDGYHYVAGLTSGLNDTGQDLYFTKYDSCMNQVLLATYPINNTSGLSGIDVYDFYTDGVDVWMMGITTNATFVTTDGTAPLGLYDSYLINMDACTGAVKYATMIGGDSYDLLKDFNIDGSTIVSYGYSYSTDYPVTNGSVHSPGLNGDIIITTFDSATGANLTSCYLLNGLGDGNERTLGIEKVGNKYHIWGWTQSTDFPTTTGAVNYTNGGSVYQFYYGVIDPSTCTIDAMTLLGSSGGFAPTDERSFDVEIINGIPHILHSLEPNGTPIASTDGTTLTTSDGMAYIILDNNLDVTYSTIFSSGEDLRFKIETDGTNVYIAQEYTGIPPFLINNGTPPTNYQYILVSKYDLNGNVIWHNYYHNQNGTSTWNAMYINDFEISNGKIGLITEMQRCYEGNILTSPGAQIGSTNCGAGIYMSTTTILDDNGNPIYVTKTTSELNNKNTAMDLMAMEGDFIYTAGVPSAFPTSDGTCNDQYVLAQMVIDLCPEFNDPTTTITGGTLTTCQNGILDEFKAERVFVDSDVVLSFQGNDYPQGGTPAYYQWQISSDNGTTWTDIGAATLQNYTPQPIVQDRCYRRLATKGDCCENELIHTTDMVCISVNSNEAPTVDGGDFFYTCPGESINIGGSPTATGGTTPYSYEWYEGTTLISTDVNPTITAVNGAIYTVSVTDANGCLQAGQTTIYAAEADAYTFPSVSNCGGAGVRIGTAPIQGIPGVIYSWSPSTGLSCDDCPNPIANPTTSTTYTLSLTIPQTTGGTCTTTDDVIVNPVAGPTTANFAGPDVTICRGATATIGTTAEAGFDYTWAPGNYLTDNHVTTTTFQPGSLDEFGDPIHYYLTAEKDGCVWYDEMYAYVIQADADIDGCGPRLIGIGDKSPGIAETYSWTKISGDGNFVSGTTGAQVPVSATTSGETIYELTTSFMGTTCTDQVEVPTCGCVVKIYVDGQHSCPHFQFHEDSGEEVCLIAVGETLGVDPNSLQFTWSPTEGLSDSIGMRVCLTDTIHRTYTVTMTSIVDPTWVCTDEIEVNHPAWSLPVYSAPDTTVCVGDDVSLGSPPVAGYSYFWGLPNFKSVGNHQFTASNPIVNIVDESLYGVQVVDDGSGCRVYDTLEVFVYPIVNAAEDILICDNSVATLGTDTIVGMTYSWTPTSSNWQNGTDENSPVPEALVTNTTTFYVTGTDVSGCVSQDSVIVTVSTIPDPFTLADVNYCPSDGPFTLGTGIPNTNITGYNWSPATVLDDPTLANPTLTSVPTTPTTFSVTITNAEGCEQIGTQYIEPSITEVLVGFNQYICLDDEVPIGDSSNPTGAGITYSWSPTTDLDNPTSPNPTFTGTTVDTVVYTLTKTENGCSTTGDVTIYVNNLTLPLLAQPSVCEGGCITIGPGTTEVGTTYSWSPTTGLDNPNIANPMACVTTTTTYTLIAENVTGCTDVSEVTINVQPTPAPTIILTDVEICANQTDPLIINPTVTPSATYNYTWSPNDGTLDNIYSASPQVVNLAPRDQTYTVTVTNTATGCSNEASVKVRIKSCPAPDFDLALDKVIDTTVSTGPYYAGDNVTFTVTVYNQGNVDATNVEITDYIPSTMTFVSSPDFSTSLPHVATIPSLAAGTSTSLNITLQINPSFTGNIIINNAEITNSTNSEGLIDDDDDLATIHGLIDDTTEQFSDNDVNDNFSGAPGISDNPFDRDDYDLARVGVSESSCSIVAINDSLTMCSGEQINLDTLFTNSSASTITFHTSLPPTTTNIVSTTLTPIASDTYYAADTTGACAAVDSVYMELLTVDSVNICSDSTNHIEMIAQPGLDNVIWFNSSDVQVGIGDTLLVDATTLGMADGMDSFYYTGDDVEGCEAGLCCPIVVITEDCCKPDICLPFTVTIRRGSRN